jgi:hypothetical protein
MYTVANHVHKLHEVHRHGSPQEYERAKKYLSAENSAHFSLYRPPSDGSVWFGLDGFENVCLCVFFFFCGVGVLCYFFLLFLFSFLFFILI